MGLRHGMVEDSQGFIIIDKETSLRIASGGQVEMEGTFSVYSGDGYHGLMS